MQNWKVLQRLLIPLVIQTVLMVLIRLLMKKGGAEDSLLPVMVADGLCIPVFAKMILSDNRSAGRPVTRKHCGGKKVLFAAGCLLLGAGLSRASSSVMEYFDLYRSLSNAVQEGLYGAPLWQQISGLCVIVPVAEELLYRGLLFRRMCEVFPIGLSAVASAAFFAFGHGNAIQALYAFPMGVLLAWCTQTGGLPAGILCHAGSNILTVIMLAAGR